MNRKKTAGLILGAFALVVSTAFTAGWLATTMPVTRFGPFYSSQVAYDSLTAGQIGGSVRTVINGSGSDTLKVGMVVYWSDTNKVNISATLANYNNIAGVVVGGFLTSDRTAIALADTSTPAAPPGKRAIILTHGRTWVLNDANGAISVGGRVIPSDATKGRVETITTAIDSNYRAVGKAVIGGAAGKAILLEVNIK